MINKVFIDYVKDYWILASTVVISFFYMLGYSYSQIYFSNFGINYLEFAELSDLISILFIHSYFFVSLPAFFIGVLLLPFFIELVLKDFYERNIIIKTTYVFFGAFVVFIVIILISSPFRAISEKVNDIKNGNEAIYEIVYGKQDSKFKCVTIVGTTTENLIYWDLSAKETVILPSKQLNKATIKMYNPPELEVDEDPTFINALSDYQKEKDKWEKMINNICN